MTVLTIRPNASNAVGAVRSSNTSYSVARSGGGTFTLFSSGGATIPGGQRLLTGTYDLNIQLFNFSPPSAVVGAVVSDVTFEWTTASINVSGGDQQAILDYASGNITAADWCDGATLAALNVWGAIPNSGFQANSQTYQVSLNSTARATIQTLLRAGGAIGFMVVAQAQVDGVAPVGNDRYDILSDDDAVAANRPALIITYSLDIEISVPLSLVGLGSLAPAVKLGAAVLTPTVVVDVAALAPTVSTGATVAAPIGGATIFRAVPAVVVDTVVRAAAAAVTISSVVPVRAGPLWQAINENQTVWADQVPAASTWSPVAAA